MNIDGANNQGQSSSNRPPARKLMVCRGVRGAITVHNNDETEILEATRELLQAMVRTNDMQMEDVASIYFTTTTDLNATYPAFAARQLGWYDLALMCGHEMVVPNSLDRCIRVLIHWNTTRTAEEIAHIYLREATSLRPDRNNVPPIKPRQISQMDAALKFLALTL